MALVLLMLLLQVTLERDGFLVAALVLQVLTMTAPGLFRPAAVVWFGFSHLLGAVMSRVLLAAVFFGVVTPIGWVRRLAGHDAMRVKAFGRGEESVLVARDHTFSAGDLEKPY
jgi:hypothetical protein